jgi:nucleotide-binding universal stress UspA family protein
MFRKILVPLDGSDEAEAILPYVSHIASGMDIGVALLSVMDRGALEMSESYYSRLFERAEQEAKGRLHNAAHHLDQDGVAAEEIVVSGRADEEITEAAERLGCNLIAMATHGRSLLGRGILGSVTDRVVHMARIPVLTITPVKARAYHGRDTLVNHIVVPLDGSDLAETVLPYVQDMAATLGYTVVLLRVVRPLHYFWVGDHPPEIHQENDLMEKEAREYMETTAEGLSEDGVDVEWRVLVGHPTTTVLEQVRDIPHSIVALTTHGRSGFRRWLIGSLAETLVRSGGDPVLIVPPPEQLEHTTDDA